MLGILLMSAALDACTPSPQDTAMRSPSPVPGTLAEGAGDTVSGRPGQAAQGPIPQPVSAVATPAPATRSEPPAAALGRRTLSTAFVRLGPDGQLTVELRDGRVLVLRNVVMGPEHYSGIQLLAGSPGAKFRGAYVDVVAARPGGAPASGSAV